MERITHLVQWISSGFFSFLLLPKNMLISGLDILKLPIDMNECVNVHVYDFLQRTGVPSKVYSHVMLSVPGIGSESVVTQIVLNSLVN